MGILGAASMAALGFFLVGLSLIVPTFGKFLVETSSLTITSPESLKGSYDSAIGNFGIPQYGGTMAGTVVYPSKQADGCTPFTESLKGPNTGGRPVFALLDRGGNTQHEIYEIVTCCVAGYLLLMTANNRVYLISTWEMFLKNVVNLIVISLLTNIT